jgi:glutathione-regulated potassium-efflux system protein KefB
MLAESPYRHELESDVEPFRSILLGLFFLSVGMTLDLAAIAARPAMIFGLAIGIIVIKAVIIAGLGLAFGMKRGRAIWLGLLLSQAGEFGFVLFGQAAAAQLVQPETASMFSAIVTLSMVSTPFLMMVIDQILRRMPEPDADLDGPEFSPETNAIVVGYGRFGQTVAQMLMAKQIPVTIIDSKPAQIELSGEFGTKVYYGDGTRLDILRTAGAEAAEAIIFCHETENFSREDIAAVLEAFPQAAILVRAYDRRQIMEWAGLEVDFIQRELFESAVVMGREALTKLGVGQREADRVVTEYRSRDEERLKAQAATGDIRAARERMFTVDSPLEDEAKEVG